jgi:hypothetical protein
MSWAVFHFGGARQNSEGAESTPPVRFCQVSKGSPGELWVSRGIIADE